jgi:pimeloyl-ACP methyl ester carboxylesterase
MPHWRARIDSSAAMAEPALTATRLAGDESRRELLVVGAGLGTSVETLWPAAARLLGQRFEVVGVDLPGHGRSFPVEHEFTVSELAAAVRRIAARLAAGRPCSYAGVSLAGAIGIEIALDPGPFGGVAVLAGAARFGEPEAWLDRAELVRIAGTPVMVSVSAERWFAPGFVEREPAVVDRMLLELSDTDVASYARCCEALAAFDARERLNGAVVPMLVAPGESDGVITPEVAAETAAAARGGVLRVIPGCAHQPPAEAPEFVASALEDHFRDHFRDHLSDHFREAR